MTLEWCVQHGRRKFFVGMNDYGGVSLCCPDCFPDHQDNPANVKKKKEASASMMTLEDFERRLCAAGIQRFKLFHSLVGWNCHATREDGYEIVSFNHDSPSSAMLAVLERAEKEK